MQYSCIPRRSMGEFSSLLYKLHRTPAAREHHDRHSPRRPITDAPRQEVVPLDAMTPRDLLAPGSHPTPPPLDIPKNHNSPRTFPQPITLQPLTTIQPIHLTPRQNGFFPLPNCPRYTAADPRENIQNILTHSAAYTYAAVRPLFHNEHGL